MYSREWLFLAERHKVQQRHGRLIRCSHVEVLHAEIVVKAGAATERAASDDTDCVIQGQTCASFKVRLVRRSRSDSCVIQGQTRASFKARLMLPLGDSQQFC